MAFEPEQIHKVAHLARLAINDNEIPAYAEKLHNIMAMIAQIQAVDTSTVTPLANPLDEQQRLRADEITEQPDPTLLQQNAPAVTAQLYLVPQVIE